MSFRLIKNRTQNVAVKGFIATAIVCGIVCIFVPWSIEVTTPFLLGWIMVWIIGASADTNDGNNSSSPS